MSTATLISLDVKSEKPVLEIGDEYEDGNPVTELTLYPSHLIEGGTFEDTKTYKLVGDKYVLADFPGIMEVSFNNVKGKIIYTVHTDEEIADKVELGKSIDKLMENDSGTAVDRIRRIIDTITKGYRP